jgi:hypothetical protein
MISGVNFSWLEDWIPIDTFKDEDQAHSAVSEFTSGVEQVAELWDRQKKAFSLSIQIDRDDDQDLIDALLWMKRALNGRAGRVWVPAPLSELFVEEHVGTGDGVSQGFILPTFGDFAGVSEPYVYDDGEATTIGARLGTANDVSQDLGHALDEASWTVRSGAAIEELSYQWLYNGRCTRLSATGGVLTAEAVTAERVQAAWPTGANVYATVAIRGDITQDVKVGVAFYDNVPALISTLYGTAETVTIGEWTLVSSGPLSIPASFDSAAVIVETDGAVAAFEILYIGGACLNIYGAGWWDPVTSPNVIQFPTAPVLGNEVTFSGRARQMRRMRLEKDNLQHAIGTMGHVNIARLKFLEVVE